MLGAISKFIETFFTNKKRKKCINTTIMSDCWKAYDCLEDTFSFGNLGAGGQKRHAHYIIVLQWKFRLYHYSTTIPVYCLGMERHSYMCYMVILWYYIPNLGSNIVLFEVDSDDEWNLRSLSTLRLSQTDLAWGLAWSCLRIPASCICVSVILCFWCKHLNIYA